jgi:hypothetical protein
MEQLDPISIPYCTIGCLSHGLNAGKDARVLWFEVYSDLVECREGEPRQWMGRTFGKNLGICTSLLMKPALMSVPGTRPQNSDYSLQPTMISISYLEQQSPAAFEFLLIMMLLSVLLLLSYIATWKVGPAIRTQFLMIIA